MVKLVGKVIVVAFWDADGALLVNLLKQGRTIDDVRPFDRHRGEAIGNLTKCVPDPRPRTCVHGRGDDQ